jgi:hypothetical protein
MLTPEMRRAALQNCHAHFEGSDFGASGSSYSIEIAWRTTVLGVRAAPVVAMVPAASLREETDDISRAQLLFRRQAATGGRSWNITNADGLIERVHPADVERLQRFSCVVIEKEEPKE